MGAKEARIKRKRVACGLLLAASAVQLAFSVFVYPALLVVPMGLWDKAYAGNACALPWLLLQMWYVVKGIICARSCFRARAIHVRNPLLASLAVVTIVDSTLLILWAELFRDIY